MLSPAAFGEFNAAYGVMMIASVLSGLGFVRYVVVPYRQAIVSGDFAIAVDSGVSLCLTRVFIEVKSRKSSRRLQ
jgi:O-antigen/teichoic acid export membrane protein